MAPRMAAMAAGEVALARAVAWPSHAASSMPCEGNAVDLNFWEA